MCRSRFVRPDLWVSRARALLVVSREITREPRPGIRSDKRHDREVGVHAFYTVPTPTTTALRPARALKPSQQPGHPSTPRTPYTSGQSIVRGRRLNLNEGLEGRHMRTCRQTRAPASHLHRGGRVCGEGPAVRVLTRRHNAARACGLGSAPTFPRELAQYRTVSHSPTRSARRRTVLLPK